MNLASEAGQSSGQSIQFWQEEPVTMSRYANVTTYYVAVSHEGLTKHLILYPGIPIEEIQLVLRASFDVEGRIVGVRDKHEVR